MVAPTAVPPALKGEPMMHALAQVHMRNHQLSPRQFLRSCYMWKFQRDISDTALANDAKRFDEQGHVSPYAVDYLIHIHGAQ